VRTIIRNIPKEGLLEWALLEHESRESARNDQGRCSGGSRHGRHGRAGSLGIVACGPVAVVD